MTDEQKKKDAEFWNALWKGWITYSEPTNDQAMWDSALSYFAELNTEPWKGRLIQAIFDIMEERRKNG